MRADSKFKKGESSIVVILASASSKIGLWQENCLKNRIKFDLVINLEMINAHLNILSLSRGRLVDN